MGNRMKLKTGQYILTPRSSLPDIINDPENLIKKITKKITINSKATNLNSVFPWIELAVLVLLRYSDRNDRLIVDLKFNLADVFLDNGDYSKAEALMEDVIEYHSKNEKTGKKKLSQYYRYLAKILISLNDFDNAKIYIGKAIDKNKTSYNNYSNLARILFYSGNNKDAEYYYKKAIALCIEKEGEEHTATAILHFYYGLFLYATGKRDMAKKYMDDAYHLLMKNLGEENLYTIRILGHIANVNYDEKKYSESFEKMKIVFSVTSKILGNDHSETFTTKNNCGRILLKMKKYTEAMDFLEKPFVLVGDNKTMLLFDYNETIMEAPELYLSKKGSSITKLIKALEKKNILIVENDALVKELVIDCCQFKPILPKYYERIAKIVKKLIP